MITVGDVFDFLNKKFPVSDALDFDNVGLLVGNSGNEVKKILVALDCDGGALKKANEVGADLIVTHHPVIFDGEKSVLSGDTVFTAVKSGISVISMHTNLDSGKGGVNDALCQKIGLNKVKPFKASDGFIIRSGYTDADTDADTLAQKIKSALLFDVRYTKSGKINRVLVCSGSGGDYIDDAVKFRFDALITADVKHHQFLKAEKHGVALFDCGHFASEVTVVPVLKELLLKKFKETEVVEFTENPIKFI